MRPIINIYEKSGTAAEYLSSLICEKMEFDSIKISLDQLKEIDDMVVEKDAALIIIELEKERSIQFYLNALRSVRVPYIFVPSEWSAQIETIILPVARFEEEREKGPFTASFARHFNSAIKIYKPNDYGTMAAKNIDAITTLFSTQSLSFTITMAKKDSGKVELEACKECNPNSLLVIGASRDYGLDDILFGPKERKIIRTAICPVMVINPRGDLYALCD